MNANISDPAERSLSPNRLTNILESRERLQAQARAFLLHAIAQVRIASNPYPGLMHFLIFWGVTIQVFGTVINLLQMQLFIPFVELAFPRGAAYLYYELIMDLAGLMILLGVLMALFRRGVLRPKSLQTRWDDIYALLLLALIPIAGFSLEGLRLVSTIPPWESWSPVGQQVANLFRTTGMTPDTAAALHKYLFWTHVSLGLVLIGSIPFTKLRHLIMTPLHIVVRPDRKDGVLALIEDIEETELLGVGQVSEFTPHQLLSMDACLNCGRCEQICPVAVCGMDYSPRRFIQSLREASFTSLIAPNGNAPQDAISLFSPEETPWNCTTCGACLSQCPAFVNPVDEVMDLRRHHVLTTGRIPTSVSDVLRNLERQGNPWGVHPDERGSPASELGVREVGPGDSVDILLFLGCVYAFDQRNARVARSFIRLLQDAGVDFAILGMDESCCGETARRLGHEYIYQVLAEQNIEAFSQISFNRIVTQCPHCFNTLKNEYPQLGGHYQVQHYTSFLTELSLAGANAAIGDSQNDGLITYHDPCYLGRYNRTISAPRELLDRTGIPRVEMAMRGAKSFCCGGGGGQMWMETETDKRINHRRLEDALATEARTIATACPYCLLMFDDAVRSKGIAEEVQVLDIAEILTLNGNGYARTAKG